MDNGTDVDNGSPKVTDEEARILAELDGAPLEEPEEPAPKGGKKTDSDVRAAKGESEDDSGDQPSGESPESEEDGDEPSTEGEESNEGDTEDDSEKREWDLLMKAAGGDPKVALRLAQAKYGSAEKAKGDEGEKKPARKRLTEDEIVAKFYEEAGSGDPSKRDSKAEAKALAAMLKTVREEAAADAEEKFERLRVESEQRARADRDTRELFAAYPALRGKSPEAAKERDAIRRHYVTLAKEGENVEGLSPKVVYRDLLGRRAERDGPAKAAKAKAEAEKKEAKTKAANAAGAANGGRPAGPGERKHVSTDQRELEILHNSRPARLNLP